MLDVVLSAKFKKDYKSIKKRKYNIELLNDTVNMIAEGIALPPKMKDHELSGEYSGCRECHISPDWLLIYRIHKDSLILVLTRTGTHSDLF